MLGLDVFQLRPLSLVDVLPSLKLPVAVNFIDVPLAMRGLAGLIVIETRCTFATVRPVDPLTVPNVAVIVAEPRATLVASPRLLIVATVAWDELHRTEAVRSCVLVSLKVPVAVNCLLVPIAMVGFAGVTASDTNVAVLTVKVAVPVTEPEVALIVVVPVPTAVARPKASIDETLTGDADHVTEVSSCVLPSSKFPTAVNC